VSTPGVVQLRGNRNLMEVRGQAGGLRADAGDSVLITRNLSEGPMAPSRSYGQVFRCAHQYTFHHERKDPEANIQIKPHDVITVPRARLIYVLGNVGRPGGYVMTENETMSLTQAVALAGGWDKMAALSGARILRSDGGPTRQQIPANVKKIMENKAPDLQMRPDDILYIPQYDQADRCTGDRISNWHRNRPSCLAVKTLEASSEKTIAEILGAGERGFGGQHERRHFRQPDTWNV
jgi:polysaccharide export outer membrane protein